MNSYLGLLNLTDITADMITINGDTFTSIPMGPTGFTGYTGC